MFFPLRDTIPSRRFPLVVWLLVAVNALVFVYELELPDPAPFFSRYAVVPQAIELNWRSFLAAPRDYLPLFTSMFLHGGFLHVFGNLWCLIIFGDNVEDRMGRASFLAFYLLCGVLAAIVHVAANAGSGVPTLGASGAIAGVMGAYFLLYPRARVITLLLLIFYPVFIEIPAFVFLGLWFVVQLYSSSLDMGGAEAGGIAFQAHVGGFLAGLLLHRFFLRRREE